MDRTTLFIPLFPAVPRPDAGPGRVLTLGFEPSGPWEPNLGPALGGPMGRLLGEVSSLLQRDDEATRLGNAPQRRQAPRVRRLCQALEPVPELVDCSGAGLGLALGLSLRPGYQLLALGRLRRDEDGHCIRVEPLRSPGRVLDLLEGLGPQPCPINCLLGAPTRPDAETRSRAQSLARANLLCRWVPNLSEALKICEATGPHARRSMQEGNP